MSEEKKYCHYLNLIAEVSVKVYFDEPLTNEEAKEKFKNDRYELDFELIQLVAVEEVE